MVISKLKSLGDLNPEGFLLLLRKVIHHQPHTKAGIKLFGVVVGFMFNCRTGDI